MVLKKDMGQPAEKADAGQTEKRDYVRLVYPPEKRPVLTVGENSFEVLNICETGLKFLNHLEEPFKQQVLGKVTFQNGGSIEINGNIRWEDNREVGLLVTQIPAFVVKQEIRTFIRGEADEETLAMGGATLEAAKDEEPLEGD